jgi:hypothetical protein
VAPLHGCRSNTEISCEARPSFAARFVSCISLLAGRRYSPTMVLISALFSDAFRSAKAAFAWMPVASLRPANFRRVFTTAEVTLESSTWGFTLI